MSGASMECVDELDTEVSYRVFGAMVGISGQAVHRHVKRGVLKRGGSANDWIRALTKHLIAEGSYRGGPEQNTLTRQRIEESKQKTISLALANEKELSKLLIAEDLASAVDMLAVSMSENIVSAGENIVAGIKLNQLPVFDEGLVLQPLQLAAQKIEEAAHKISAQLRPTPRTL